MRGKRQLSLFQTEKCKAQNQANSAPGGNKRKARGQISTAILLNLAGTKLLYEVRLLNPSSISRAVLEQTEGSLFVAALQTLFALHGETDIQDSSKHSLVLCETPR